MNTKKLTLEDLKLESFLTEIEDTKLVKMQGGDGAYAGTDGGDACGNSGECNSCECPTQSDQSYECTESNYDICETGQVSNEDGCADSEYYTCGANCHDGGTGWHC